MSEIPGIYKTGASGLFASMARAVVELEPCPYCGSNRVHVETTSGSVILNTRATHFVMCDECSASGPKMVVKLNAIASWNNPGGGL